MHFAVFIDVADFPDTGTDCRPAAFPVYNTHGR